MNTAHNLNSRLLGSSLSSEARAERTAEFDRAIATIDESIAAATTVLFPGGAIRIRKPTTEQLVASALDWLKLAAEEDAADLAADQDRSLGPLERRMIAGRLSRHLDKARAALMEIGK